MLVTIQQENVALTAAVVLPATGAQLASCFINPSKGQQPFCPFHREVDRINTPQSFLCRTPSHRNSLPLDGHQQPNQCISPLEGENQGVFSCRSADNI